MIITKSDWAPVKGGPEGLWGVQPTTIQVEQNCQLCLYYTRFCCHRRSPAVGLNIYEPSRGEWPRTEPTDWCGEFADRPKEKDQ